MIPKQQVRGRRMLLGVKTAEATAADKAGGARAETPVPIERRGAALIPLASPAPRGTSTTTRSNKSLTASIAERRLSSSPAAIGGRRGKARPIRLRSRRPLQMPYEHPTRRCSRPGTKMAQLRWPASGPPCLAKKTGKMDHRLLRGQPRETRSAKPKHASCGSPKPGRRKRGSWKSGTTSTKKGRRHQSPGWAGQTRQGEGHGGPSESNATSP